MKMVIRLFLLGMVVMTVSGCPYRAVSTGSNDGIRLTIHAPDAHHVTLLSSLNRYESVSMKPNQSGSWEIQLVSDHEFTYFFEVDGKTMLNDCRFTEIDEWGNRICVFIPEEVP
jgi:1,4-alpha-glucan branching enzyme